MVTPTIDALYRKIAGIENPLLCWSLASTRWNDNGICIPKELCSKIRCYLPPSTFEALPSHPRGGYTVDENIRFCPMKCGAVIEVKTGEVEYSMMFGNEHYVDPSMRLSSYCWKTGDVSCAVINPDIDRLNIFYHTIGSIDIISREIASEAKHRDVVVGAHTCHVPISKINFDLPETREHVKDLKDGFGGNHMMIKITADPDTGRLEFCISGSSGVMWMSLYTYSIVEQSVSGRNFTGSFSDVVACEKAVLALAASFF